MKVTQLLNIVTGKVNTIWCISLDENIGIVLYEDENSVGYVIIAKVLDGEMILGDVSTLYASGQHVIRACRLDEIRFAVAYLDSSGYGTAQIGRKEGNSIVLGNAHRFIEGTSKYFDIGSFSEDKIIVAYRDDNNAGKGTARVGGINSEMVISWGVEAIFYAETLTAGTNEISLAVLDSNTVGINYRREKYVQAAVGTRTDNTMSFGNTAMVGSILSSDSTVSVGMRWDQTWKKAFVVTFQDSFGSPRGICMLITAVNPPSFGTKFIFYSGSVSSVSSSSLDDTSFVFSYVDNNGKGVVSVGKVLGDIISFPWKMVFCNSGVTDTSISVLDEDRVMILYVSSGTVRIIYIHPGYGFVSPSNSIVGIATDSNHVQIEGTISGFSSLVPGQRLFADESGGITKNEFESGFSNAPLGIALSEDAIRIRTQ